MNTITAQHAQKELTENSAVLLDVRTAEEIEIVNVSGSINIPMNDIPQRISDLNPQQRIIVMCHHGMRSERVARYLEQQGFSDVLNLEGGIDQWAADLDDNMLRY